MLLQAAKKPPCDRKMVVCTREEPPHDHGGNIGNTIDSKRDVGVDPMHHLSLQGQAMEVPSLEALLDPLADLEEEGQQQPQPSSSGAIARRFLSPPPALLRSFSLTPPPAHTPEPTKPVSAQYLRTILSQSRTVLKDNTYTIQDST
jgi:hypothetical protein